MEHCGGCLLPLKSRAPYATNVQLKIASSQKRAVPMVFSRLKGGIPVYFNIVELFAKPGTEM